jgi:signal transduction histidine kinase
MRRLAAQTAKDHGIACRSTSTHSQLGYSRDAAVHLYRIAQQAIDNAIRHGRATSIEVKLEQEEKLFRLVVSDNGLGYTGSGGPIRGLGLRTMAFRADVIGGTFRIVANAEGGTCVEVVVPDLSALLPGSAELDGDTSAQGTGAV